MVRVKGAKRFPKVPAKGMTRRATRDMNTGKVLEDQWIDSRTHTRLIKRELREPRDIEVRIHLTAEEKEEQLAWGDVELPAHEASQFRAASARLNSVALDRPDVMLAAKECSRRMARPTNNDWDMVIKFVRYRMIVPRLVQTYDFQDPVESTDVFCDSNWAGCRATRRNTSGACIVAGGRLLKAYSRTQAVVAPSSAEAELYSLVMAASEALGIRVMAADFEVELETCMSVDASAAIGIARKKGLGKIRRIETQALWVQDVMHSKCLNLEHVPGKDNPSGVQTKYLDAASMEKHLKKICAHVKSGRPEIVLDHVPRGGGPECRGEMVDEIVSKEAGIERLQSEASDGKEGKRAERVRLRRAWAWWHAKMLEHGGR